jgi:serine/threonine protein kinase
MIRVVAGATGTVDWMSPELLSEALHVPDRATDQWALGECYPRFNDGYNLTRHCFWILETHRINPSSVMLLHAAVSRRNLAGRT